jgi:site-specific DNA recombinase
VSIVEAEAEVVREIFARYAAGETAQAIAADLNARAITGARGGKWTTAQISGSRQRANGVLQTELYAGVKVWNRMDVRKDPATGKRRPVMKPESEWRRTPVPHLAIVEARRCGRPFRPGRA